MDDALTGFHGKLPAAGDFVTRGLPTGLAAFWDGWAARHLTGRTGWPAGGLRLRLASGGRVAAAVAVPGSDRVGRRFPLAAFVIAPALPAPADLTPWCDAADAALREALEQGLSPDDLALQLAALQPPQGQADGPPMQLWTAAAPPAPCDPADPGALLDRLFSCS
jgi:type VI secretion system protein ImpM